MLAKLRALRSTVALPARHLVRPIPFAIQRHLSYGSAIGLKRLRMLEEDANRNPSDAAKQLALMVACNKSQQPSVAVRRFESGNFGSDDAVTREYIKALAQSGQLARLSLNQLAGQHGEVGMAQRIAGAPHALDGFQQPGRGTTDEPLHVQWHESPRAQLWKMLRMLAFAGVTGAVLMTLVDEKSLPKGLGFSVDVQPVAQSNKRFTDVVGVDEAKQATTPP